MRPTYKIDIEEYEQMEDMAWERDTSHDKEKLSSYRYDDSAFHNEAKQWREIRQNGRGKAWVEDE